MKIGRIVKELRKSKNIKQKDLAKKLDISYAYLSCIENNKKEPSLDLVKGLAKCLCVPVGYFFVESFDASDLKGRKKKVLSEIKKLLTEFLELKGGHGKTI